MVEKPSVKQELPFVTVVLWKNDKDLANGFASSF